MKKISSLYWEKKKKFFWSRFIEIIINNNNNMRSLKIKENISFNQDIFPVLMIHENENQN